MEGGPFGLTEAQVAEFRMTWGVGGFIALEEVVHKKNVLLFTKQERTARNMDDSRTAALRKGYCERKKTVVTREGAEIDIDLCFAPLKDAASRVTGFIGIARHAAH